MSMLSPKTFSEVYQVDEDLVLAAQEKIKNKDVLVLGVSGKLGAGKDTVAPLVLDSLGYTNSVHEFFAKHLKVEVTEAIQKVKDSSTLGSAIDRIELEQNVERDKAELIVDNLWTDVKSGLVADAYIRTSSTRFALQFWGSDIRREQDPNYWVKKAIRSTVTNAAEGKSVLVTDARFENEIDALMALGAFASRLHVSADVQRERIFNRDGIYPSSEALNHISEISLDRYERNSFFDVVVDTDIHNKFEVAGIIVDAIKIWSGR